MRSIFNSVLFWLVLVYSSNVFACADSWIFRTRLEKNDCIFRIAAKIGIHQGGAFLMFTKAQHDGHQESFDATLKILNSDLEDELPFFIARSIVHNEEFAVPSMRKQLAESEPVRRAIDIVLQKQREREKITELYRLNFSKTEKSCFKDPYYISGMLDIVCGPFCEEKIQDARYSWLQSDIVFPVSSYFTQDSTGCTSKVNERFLNDFWDNLKLRKLEIERCLDTRRYSLLECLLFEKEQPSAKRMTQLHESYWQSYSVLESLSSRILDEAKKGNELCMEALCYLLRAYYEHHVTLFSQKWFTEFVEGIEKDEALMTSLVTYFRSNTMLNIQKLIAWSWKYKDIAESIKTGTDTQESFASSCSAKKQKYDDTDASKTPSE